MENDNRKIKIDLSQFANQNLSKEVNQFRQAHIMATENISEKREGSPIGLDENVRIKYLVNYGSRIVGDQEVTGVIRGNAFELMGIAKVLHEVNVIEENKTEKEKRSKTNFKRA